MAEYAELGGLPFKVSPNQQQALADAGTGQYQPVDEGTAVQGNQALQDVSRAEDRYGTMGSAALGLSSGLSLGMGPGVAAALGFLDPTDVGALEGTSAYQLGDFAGMVIPTLVSGGEYAGARGLAASALRATPAGLMGRLGTASERLALRVLPGSGPIAKGAISMAARGATEGALINLGHTIGNSLIQNKPLSAEALWASGTDGALAGGLVGGGLGVVGGLGSVLTEKLPGAVSGAVKGTSEKYLGATARRLGMTEEQVIEAQANGTLRDTLKNYRGVLDKEGSGVTYGSKSSAIKEAATNYRGVSRGIRDSVVDTLDEQAPMAVPRVERVLGDLQTTAVGLREGTLAEKDAKRWFAEFSSELRRVERATEFAGEKAPKPRYLDFRGKTPEGTTPRQLDSDVRKAMGAYKEAVSKWESTPAPKVTKYDPGTWKAWIESRDFLADRIKQGVYRDALEEKLAKEALGVMDREIESAMRGAAESIGDKGLADKFLGAQLDMRYATELAETVGKKAAKELLAHETTFTPRDIAVLGGMGVVGNPALALSWAAAKGVGRRINQWAEPALAEAAYQRSIGARAAGAEQKATLRIRDSVRNFFRSASTAGRQGVSARKAKSDNRQKGAYDRAAYEAAVGRASQLVSSNHAARVRDLQEGLAGAGYAELGQSLAQTYQRAAQYVGMNMPPRRAAGALGSLRATPKIHGLDMQEFKFLRIMNGIKNPFAILDKLEDGGTASRDEVRAMKYVYPELHAQIVQEAAQQIMELKQEGKHMPMDKIAHLGVILDAPIDSMLDGSRIRPIQASFIPPEPPPDAAPPPPPQGPMIDQMMQTPMEQMV